MEIRLKRLQPIIQELFELSSSPGLSLGVLLEGVPVFTPHFGRRKASDPTPPNDDTLYNVASFTKLMTAGVISNPIERGLLDWDVPIREYLPEFGERKDDVGQKSTVADLLANRTGLSAQATFWGVMMEDILPDRELIPRLSCYIPTFGEFRKTFVYSSWGYALITSAIERVTSKPFSSCVEEYIFRPLGMGRSTTNLPQVDNVVFKHWVDTDGVAHEFPWSASRGWFDETGFAGAVAARSSTKELLIMYCSLLHVFDHQTRNNTDSTPSSPSKYARRLLSPHVGVGNASPKKQGYCLGTYRTELPGNMSAASYNTLLLQKKHLRQFEKHLAGRAIYHQIATFTGYNGSMMMDPQSQTALFVLVNSLPLFDVTDVASQLLLGAILEESDPPDYVSMAKMVKDANLQLYERYIASLEKRKTDTPLSFPLNYYKGDYWNKDRVICHSVYVHRSNQLRVNVKGSSLTNYILISWGRDLFCFPPNRELELSSSMWPFTSLKSRMFMFNCSEDGVSSFTWYHDPTPGSKPGTFSKATDSPNARL